MKVSSIAEFLGIHRSTLYRWIYEAAKNGYEALKPKSNRPNNAIEVYGPPREILTDHCAQFYTNIGNGVSSYDLWLYEKKIKYIGVHPQNDTIS